MEENGSRGWRRTGVGDGGGGGGGGGKEEQM